MARMLWALVFVAAGVFSCTLTGGGMQGVAVNGNFSTSPQSAVIESRGSGMKHLNEKIAILASQLASNMKGYDVQSRSMVVTTFVDLDSLEETARIGRHIPERLIYELHMQGFRVFEIRQAKEVKVEKYKGEFYLTREASQLLNAYSADAVILGTYELIKDDLVVNARVLEKNTSRVLSVGTISFSIADNKHVAKLMSDNVKNKRYMTPLLSMAE